MKGRLKRWLRKEILKTLDCWMDDINKFTERLK